VGSARFGDAWHCGCSDRSRRSCAKLGPAGGEGQHGGSGDSGRAGAGLGRARHTIATCRGPAAFFATATTTWTDTRIRSTSADMGRTGTIGSARRTHRSGGSHVGRCSPGPATAAGTRAILGCTWSRCAGRAAGPHMGLARARS
jgi:hypothetical protein